MKASSPVVLDKEEKEIFALALYETRKEHADWGWSKCFAEARQILPKDRQIGKHVDHPNKMPWIRPLLDQYELEDEKKAKAASALTEADKDAFADSVFKIKTSNPDMSWEEVLNAGRKAMPPNKKIADSYTSPSQITWLSKRLAILKEQMPTDQSLLKTNIRLKEDEKRMFAETVYDFMLANPKSPWREAFELANQSLPENRRIGSSIKSPANVKWFNEVYKEIEKDRLKNPKKVAAPVEVAAPEPQLPAPASLAYQDTTNVVHRVESHVMPPEIDFVGQIIGAIVGAVKSSLNEIAHSPRLTEALKEALAPPEQTKVERVDTREKIMIVGLLPEQQQDVSKEWGKVFDLRFFENGDKGDNIKATLPHVKRAVLMTKFASHSTQNAMRGHAGFHYCNGSVTALKQQLHSWMKAKEA